MPLFQPPPPNPVVSATGAQPLAPNKAAAAITGEPAPPPVDVVDNPPGFIQQIPIWQPRPPLPILPRYLVQAALRTPYVNEWIDVVLRAWQPPPPSPILPRYYPQSVAAPAPPEVDDPPGFIQQTPVWVARPPLPILPPKYPQGAVVEKVPFELQWLSTVLQAWQQAPPPLTILERVTPPSVDNPPRLKRLQLFHADAVPLPTLQEKYPQPFVQVQQDQPFNQAWFSILKAWQPQDPPLLIPKQITPPSVDNPPLMSPLSPVWRLLDITPTIPSKYPQPFVQVQQDLPYVRVWQDVVLRAWQADLLQPELPNKVTPPSVDNPPRFKPWQSPTQPDIPQIVLPNQVTPGIPGRSVDNPPRFRPWQSPVQADVPQIVLPNQVTPGIPGRSVDNPPRFRPWQSPVQAEAPQVILPNQVTPGIPGRSVDNPPRLTRQPIFQADAVPLPTLPERYPQPFVQVQQDQPYRPDWLIAVLQAWQAGDVQNFRRLLNPSIIAVRVDDPPFDRRRLEDFLLAWRPPPPMPTIPRRITPPSVDDPPFMAARLEAAWRLLDPYQQARQFYPQAFVAEAGQVPFTQQLLAILAAWFRDDFRIILPTLLDPGIPGMSVDNPPRLLRVQQPSFEPVRLPILPARGGTITGIAVNDPPFDRRHLEEFLRQWQPPDPLPTLPRWLAAELLAVAVNNPPFTHLGRKEIDSIIAMWRDPRWDLWWTMKVPPIIQPGPPPVILAERFTVSGPTVQDLFGPIGDVSHNWSGGTQKRTV